MGTRRALKPIFAISRYTPIVRPDRVEKWQEAVLWLALFLYLDARICQLFADRLPSLPIVVLHVVPPAAFALVHGSIVYRRKGILLFAVTCLSVSGAIEMLGLRTGFPFGHYYFTDVMGPKAWGLPFLLVLAYLGIGYCSWVVAVLILGARDKPLRAVQRVAVPALAAFVMLAWDLSMEADWSTVDKAWIWRDGGLYFGVPVSNFFGWYLTAYVFFQVFALYCSRRDSVPSRTPIRYWRMPILMYAMCALGNLLILKQPLAPPVVVDPAGHRWVTMQILVVDAVVSVGLMLPMCVAAWTRARGAGRPAESYEPATSA